MMKDVYKVVQKISGRYLSCAAPFWQLVLEYRLGEKTSASIGKVLVFPEEHHALAFRRRLAEENTHLVVLKGLAEGLTKPPPWRIHTLFCDSSNLGKLLSVVSRFWRDPSDYTKWIIPIVHYSTWPEGTMAADSFTPEREVEM